LTRACMCVWTAGTPVCGAEHSGWSERSLHVLDTYAHVCDRWLRLLRDFFFSQAAMARISKQERSQYKVLKELGWTISGIARHYGRTRNDVKLWLQRTDSDSNNEAVSEKRGRGRKRKSSMKDDERIVKRYKAAWRPFGYGRRRIQQDLQKNPIGGVPQVSGNTVYRRLQEKAGKMIVVPKKFLLTDVHKTKRRKWATAMKGEDFETWLFSDENDVQDRKQKARSISVPGRKARGHQVPTACSTKRVGLHECDRGGRNGVH
jgi:hypothetical protein